MKKIMLFTVLSVMFCFNAKSEDCNIHFDVPEDFSVCSGDLVHLNAELIDGTVTEEYKTMWWRKGASEEDWIFIAGASETKDFPTENTVYRFEVRNYEKNCQNVYSVNVSIAIAPKIVEVREVDKKLYEIIVTYGTLPYEFSIDNENTYQFENLFSINNAGTHTAYVRDNSGCKTSADFVVPDNTGIAETGYDPLQPKAVGYSNVLGQKLSKEPENGLYIILYKNGKAEKILK